MLLGERARGLGILLVCSSPGGSSFLACSFFFSLRILVAQMASNDAGATSGLHEELTSSAEQLVVIDRGPGSSDTVAGGRDRTIHIWRGPTLTSRPPDYRRLRLGPPEVGKKDRGEGIHRHMGASPRIVANPNGGLLLPRQAPTTQSGHRRKRLDRMLCHHGGDISHHIP